MSYYSDFEQRLVEPARALKLHRRGAIKKFLLMPGRREQLDRISHEQISRDTSKDFNAAGKLLEPGDAEEMYEEVRQTLAPDLKPIRVYRGDVKSGLRGKLLDSLPLLAAASAEIALAQGVQTAELLTSFPPAEQALSGALMFGGWFHGSLGILYGFSLPFAQYRRSTLPGIEPSILFSNQQRNDFYFTVAHELHHQWSHQVAGRYFIADSLEFQEGFANVAAFQALRDCKSGKWGTAYHRGKMAIGGNLLATRVWLQNREWGLGDKPPSRYDLGTAAALAFEDQYNISK